MANSCVYRPTIKVGSEERDSKLFDGLLSLTGNREQTKALWALSKSQSFMSALSGIEKDSNGEPTLESFSKAINLESILRTSESYSAALVASGANDINGNNIIYETEAAAFKKADSFNDKNSLYVAVPVKSANGYSISVQDKNSNNPTPSEVRFNHVLNQKLQGIMQSLGFDVEAIEKSEHAGLFDPANAKDNVRGFKTVIQVAKGEVGEEAFPEEWAHFMIEGLFEDPLVDRLIYSLMNNSELEQILGDEYEEYLKLYKGDITMLAKEAAGKLLAGYITKSMPSTRTSILERIWEIIKSLFTGTSVQTIDDSIAEAARYAEELADKVMSPEILDRFDKNNVLNSSALYSASKTLTGMNKLLDKAIETASRRMAILADRSSTGMYDPEDVKRIKELQQLQDRKFYARGCIQFLMDSVQQLNYLSEMLDKLSASTITAATPQEQMAAVASTLRQIKEFATGYEDIIDEMQTIKYAKERGSVLLTDDEADMIEEGAIEVNKIMRNLKRGYKELRDNLVFSFMKNYWGEDKVIEFGKDAGGTMTLDMALQTAVKDINFVDRLVNSMSDASDPILSTIDKVVKVTKSKRDEQLQEMLAGIRKIHKDLTKDGYNTDFMYERDNNGNLTGYLLSDIDFNKYQTERNAYYESLKASGVSYIDAKNKMTIWDRDHTERVIVSDKFGIEEVLPKKSLYYKDGLSDLSPAQRAYYDEMMEIKAYLGSLVPSRFFSLYMAVPIRNDITQAIQDNIISDPKKAIKILWGNIKDQVMDRPDDTAYGMTTTTSESKIRLGFDGKPVERLPVYYSRPLEDPSRLSTDFTATIAAYAGMALNYSEMNKIIDCLELVRDEVREREVKQNKGQQAIEETRTILGRIFNHPYVKTGKESNIGGLLDDYYSSAIYGKYKNEGNTLGNTGINTSKVADLIKSYSGVVGLGINTFAAISNVLQGKIQQWIDSSSKEFFGMSDLLVADKEYGKLLPEYLAEVGSSQRTSMMALLMDKFNATEDFYDDIRREGFYKTGLARIFGNASLYFLNNMGEHYLHCTNMLAMLNRVTVKDASGKEIKLRDAFERKNDDGVITLVIKKGVTDLDGNLLSTEGLEPGSEEFDIAHERAQRYIADLKNKIGKVSQSLNGAFNADDRGSIHRFALGRMVMQFRQWMPAHYGRRFNTRYYDAATDSFREGYYNTLGKFLLNTMKDLKAAKFEVVSNFKNLTNYEKSNMYRAFTELGIWGGLCLLTLLVGGEDDKDTWGEKMALYQLKRMRLETGASVPWISGIENAFTIVQSPAASINTIENLIDILKFNNMFVEVKSGRYKGMSQWEKDVLTSLPAVGQVKRVLDLRDENYMFTILNR